MHVAINRVSKYMNQEVKGEKEKLTIKVEDFQTLLSAITATNRKSEETNLETPPINLTNIFRKFHSTTQNTHSY